MALMKVTREVLEGILDLPHGSTLTEVQYDSSDGVLDIYIEGGGLPEGDEVISPVYGSDESIPGYRMMDLGLPEEDEDDS